MRIAILTNDANGYPKPMGLTLQRMRRRIGVESKVVTAGWERIRSKTDRFLGRLRDLTTRKTFRVVYSEQRKWHFLKKL